MNVCGVVVNRVLPDDPEGDSTSRGGKQEQVYVEEIEQRFSGYPLAWVPQLATDVYGLDNLDASARYRPRIGIAKIIMAGDEGSDKSCENGEHHNNWSSYCPLYRFAVLWRQSLRRGI